jgi:hypothetical protein
VAVPSTGTTLSTSGEGSNISQWMVDETGGQSELRISMPPALILLVTPRPSCSPVSSFQTKATGYLMLKRVNRLSCAMTIHPLSLIGHAHSFLLWFDETLAAIATGPQGSRRPICASLQSGTLFQCCSTLFRCRSECLATFGQSKSVLKSDFPIGKIGQLSKGRKFRPGREG